MDGKPVDDGIVLGMAALVLIAGVDTTWSAIGSSLWHLATHPDDRKRLVAEPELMPTAVEELLRAYSPVTMAREVTEDIEYAGCPMKAGDKVLMNFPAANRDPEVFEHPDEVQLDRAHNRHVAFGSGIHRCAGSNLARMELQVALEEWLARIPDFSLAEGAEVTWAGGQVRGPRILPGGVPMKIRVDPDKCQGHARCYGLAPEIFDVDDYGQASVIVDDGAARARGEGAAGRGQLPRVRHRDHQRVAAVAAGGRGRRDAARRSERRPAPASRRRPRPSPRPSGPAA